MPMSDISRGRQILTRFLALAEERLAYLTELYETGRWPRYFTQQELLDNVRDAKKAVAAWSLLVSTEALPNNRPVDLSWLESSRPLPPRRPLMPDVEMLRLSPRFAELSPAPAIAVSAAPDTVADQPGEPSLPAWHDALNFALMNRHAMRPSSPV